MLMKFIHRLYLLSFLTVLFSIQSYAQSPRAISYQGMLLDGASHPVTGSRILTVAFYDSPTSTNALHSETFQTTLNDGVFSVQLGAQKAFAPSMRFDKQYWIGVRVDE